MVPCSSLPCSRFIFAHVLIHIFLKYNSFKQSLILQYSHVIFSYLFKFFVNNTVPSYLKTNSSNCFQINTNSIEQSFLLAKLANYIKPIEEILF